MRELCLLVLVLYKSFVYSSKSSRVPFRRWFACSIISMFILLMANSIMAR